MASKVDMSDYDKLGCLHEMFMSQARRTPDKIAVIGTAGEQVTSGELDKLTDILAAKLRIMGVAKNCVVGILMERCLEYTVAYIAILKAGGAYLPIEVSYPSSLLASVLDDSKPVAVLTKFYFKHRLPDHIQLLLLEGDWVNSCQADSAFPPLPNIYEPVTLDDAAYVVYSSGTTGKPKGIQCPHRGAVFSYTWRHKAYPYEENEREACNIFFVWEMLRPLLKGVPMYIIPDTVIYDPARLMTYIEKNSITRILFTPSLLQAVLDVKGVDFGTKLKSLRQVWLCGEVVTMALRNQLISVLPQVRLLNLYSISECHDVACSDLSASIKLEDRIYCPVGKVLPGVHVLVMDKGNVVQTGSSGEIYVGGPTLAIGYLNRPDLNFERFIKTPQSIKIDVGDRLYKTGDWGYVLSDGSLEITGRCDTVVKIRGYTVELKAIESALMSIPEVNMCTVLAIGDEGAEKMLVAYVVLANGYSEDTSFLKSKLRDILPFYMIPSHFIYLDNIPLQSTTGKIDKNLLPKMQNYVDEGARIFGKSLSTVEKAVARIWCDTLSLATLEVDDNFFHLGGHSLLAAACISQINQVFEKELSTFDLYVNPTVSSLSKKLETGLDDASINLNLQDEVQKYAAQTELHSTKLHAFWKSVGYSKKAFECGNIFLTGATGYVGSYILKELLQSTHCIVYCLVRSNKSTTAKDRFHKIFDKLNIQDGLKDRVVLVEGDVSLLQFGLPNAEYLALCYDITCVIHAAAYVNLVLPYAALRSANVIGTRNIISFCISEKFKPLHCISTNDVFPRDGNIWTESSISLQNAKKLTSGYGQSKWVAEQLVLSASRVGLPTIITRCGNVGGPRSFFDWTWNISDMTLFILKAVCATQFAPDVSWKVELTPVDLVSGTIVQLTQRITDYYGKIFHLVNPKPLDCRVLWKIMIDAGYDLKIVSYEHWIEEFKKIAAKDESLKSVVQLFDSVLKKEEYLVCENCYSLKNTQEFLLKSYPAVNTQLMRMYIEKLIECGYIEKPSQKGITSKENVQIAFVTGATSGIGYAITEKLNTIGYTVVAVGRNVDKLNVLCEENANIIPLQVDVTNENQVKQAVNYVESNIGPISTLIYSAGVMFFCETKNAELSHWKQMVDVNCIGLLNCITHILPLMTNRKYGHIINISSDAGRRSFPGLAVYSGTKFFVEGFSGALRLETKFDNVKVTTIQPGDVETGLHDKSTDKRAAKQYASDFQYLESKNVADAVAFVVSQPSNCSINEVLVQPLLGAM